MATFYRNIKVINLTPHSITFAGEGKILKKHMEFPASGSIARVSVEYRRWEMLEINGKGDAIPTFFAEYGDVTGVPDKVANTILIVSQMVRERLPHRDDVYSPGELVRDEKGNVIGCIGLVGNKIN